MINRGYFMNKGALWNTILKCPDVKVQHPVVFLARDSDVERVQRLMLAAPRPKTIRKTQEVLLPDLVENRPYRVLDHFVFQRRDSQWSLPPIAFRRSAHTVQPAWPALPTRCSAQVRLFHVLLGQRSSLHILPRPLPALVR